MKNKASLINATPDQFTFKLSTLVAALVAVSVPVATGEAAVSYDAAGTATYSKTGDLSIYQPPVGDVKPTIMLMLDKSGSMDGSYSFLQDLPTANITRWRVRKCTAYFFGICISPVDEYYDQKNQITNTKDYRDATEVTDKSIANFKGANGQSCVFGQQSDDFARLYNPLEETVKISDIDGEAISPSIDIKLTYCNDTSTNPQTKVYDRISNLKLALIDVLQNESLTNKVQIGVGSFGYPNSNAQYGLINKPAKVLDTAQKKDIYTFISGLSASGGTPTARAFNEAGAYLLGKNTNSGGNSYSGFKNTSDSTIVDGTNYRKPNSSQCAGNGVYLLTDGTPNTATTNDTPANYYTQRMMQDVMGSSYSCTGMMSNTGTDFGDDSGWSCIGDYAKALNNKGIKTAMVGFGATFSGVDKPANYTVNPLTLSDGTIYQKKYYDCSKLSAEPDAKNSCNVGMESEDPKTGFTGYSNVGGYGQGGFYYAKNSQDIVGSILAFISKLDNSIPSIPSGTITIPQDPLNPINLQPYAYLPMIEPKVNSGLTIWPGNLKKYEVNQGTLYGKTNPADTTASSRLYIQPKDANGNVIAGSFPTNLNPSTLDLWSTIQATELDKDGNTINVNDRVTSGGFYARLISPVASSKPADNSTRNVYIENGTGLLKVGVSSGELVGFDKISQTDYAQTLTDSSGTTFNDKAVKTKIYLLNFLGYDITKTDDEIKAIANATNVEAELKKLITTPSGNIRVLGGIVHSQPTLVTYSGKINAPNKPDPEDPTKIAADAGQVSTKDTDRDDYLVFGSMDGALHLAKSATGEEGVAIIPKIILKNQLAALKKDSKEGTDVPKFGVDAPWSTKANYKYTFNKDGSGTVSASDVQIFGGLGRGGMGFYGYDVSTVGTPTQKFAITNTTTGFERMGHIFSKPVVGKIQVGSTKSDIKDVLIFGGGYDLCYEDPTFKLNATGNKFAECDLKTSAQGNAVYIVDASNGSLIASFSSSTAAGKNVNVAKMTHSVVSEITTLDRDNDGLIDHLYFGDLGGQIFRIDLQNGKALNTTPAINTLVRRVTRVLNTQDFKADGSNKLIDKGLQYRFYNKPSVSFYKPSGYTVRMAVVNIASGDRSNPLSRDRDINTADRVFGIFDRDIARQDLYGDDKKITDPLKTSELTMDNLATLPFDNLTSTSGTKLTKADAISAMKAGTYQGWNYPLTYFDGYGNVKYVKSVGDGLSIGNIYYMTAYSPEMAYDTNVSSCSAQVIGGSERQMYCLPWGVCEQKAGTTADNSTNGMGGYIRAGKGIQELTLGAYSKEKTNIQMLIGNQTLKEIIDKSNRSDFGQRSKTTLTGDVVPIKQGVNTTGSDLKGELGMGSGTPDVIGIDFGLVPKRWYQKQTN
ncbi:hypothetical protein A9Z64_10235 [Moraxella osloensis]|uniref:Tfp pilus assembly protein, tip-associated adhesin PilY1 n=2 Tax=Faucicola osloensis TaxID=34062 RepID=A0A378QCP3_FAUOS|nr:hypothetical protein AXE82_03555 [Moraxella osloensis]OBX54454.1 hypothetical protein A9Z64_10235 [Moraxella osloensis]STY96987.1 Tfp pilus assembly protein, tip-associated adhesin PilY1 [Moraxella osloensis]